LETGNIPRTGAGAAAGASGGGRDQSQGSSTGDPDEDEDEAGPRHTDLWIPCSREAYIEAYHAILLLGLPSAGYIITELLGHYFILIVAGTVSEADVVALRITEGLMWPALVITLSVLEAVAARAAVYVAAGKLDDATTLQFRARALVCCVIGVITLAELLLPADILAYPFYNECEGTDGECAMAVALGKPLSIVALATLAVDAFRLSD